MKKIDFIRIIPCFVGKLLYYRHKEYHPTNACQNGDPFINGNIIIDKCICILVDITTSSVPLQ